jgi:hypothetical protein
LIAWIFFCAQVYLSCFSQLEAARTEAEVEMSLTGHFERLKRIYRQSILDDSSDESGSEADQLSVHSSPNVPAPSSTSFGETAALSFSTNPTTHPSAPSFHAASPLNQSPVRSPPKPQTAPSSSDLTIAALRQQMASLHARLQHEKENSTLDDSSLWAMDAEASGRSVSLAGGKNANSSGVSGKKSKSNSKTTTVAGGKSCKQKTVSASRTSRPGNPSQGVGALKQRQTRPKSSKPLGKASGGVPQYMVLNRDRIAPAPLQQRGRKNQLPNQGRSSLSRKSATSLSAGGSLSRSSSRSSSQSSSMSAIMKVSDQTSLRNIIRGLRKDKAGLIQELKTEKKMTNQLQREITHYSKQKEREDILMAEIDRLKSQLAKSEQLRSAARRALRLATGK